MLSGDQVKVVATARCKHCSMPIKQQDWGNGGKMWTHDNDRVNCHNPTYAEPCDCEAHKKHWVEV